MQNELNIKQNQARYYLESCQLDLALPAYEELFNIFTASNTLTPNFLEDFAEVLTNTENLEKAKEIFTLIIQMFPPDNPQKYFSLAQLLTGEDSAKAYLKGIELSDLSEKPSIASAYSALAELYLTDLSDCPEAQSLCENYINAAIDTDELCIEAYLSLSSLNLARQNLEASKEALKKLKVLLENCGSDHFPSCDFLVKASKNFIECQEYEGLEYLTEVGLLIDENNFELVYLRAFSLFKLGKIDEAKKTAGELIEKSPDQDLIEACDELLSLISN